MSDQYTHGLAADWRQRHAMSTADKVGGSFTGWRPKAPGTRANHLRAAAFALIAAGFLTLIERSF